MEHGKEIGIVVMSLLLVGMGVTGANGPPEIEVTKTADPTDIMIAGSGLPPEETTITLTVTGYGGTTTETLPIDVVYGIDSSGSMGWNDPTNLRLAAAKDFTDSLDPARDQGGVVSWDGGINFTYGLNSNLTELKNQIDNVDSSGGTNIEAGLSACIDMVDANGRIEASAEVIIFLSNGQGTYTGAATADAVSEGYVIYSIGLNTPSGSQAEADLMHMADATGGTYYASPDASNLQAIFDDIYTEVIISTAPSDVDVIEVTQDYIVDEASFSIAPDSIVELVGGQTEITWLNVAQYVGNYDDRLAADETFTVEFTAKSSLAGDALPLDDDVLAVVEYDDPGGNPQSVAIPQAYINVNTPPDCSNAMADPAVLWPPNHKFVDVSILGVTDPDGDPLTITIDSIFQDEPVKAKGQGSGNTSPDGMGVGTDTASVRAERNGDPKTPGNGRVYHIGFTADDGNGGTCSCTVTVCVPHDQSDGECVDEGPLYDSTQID